MAFKKIDSLQYVVEWFPTGKARCPTYTKVTVRIPGLGHTVAVGSIGGKLSQVDAKESFRKERSRYKLDEVGAKLATDLRLL